MEGRPENVILRGIVGSTAHGLALEGTDDLDEMGICIESPRDALIENFEQYIYRTAAEREGKQDARSQPGDTDLVIYSLRKWTRLALKGNPTIILMLYLPDYLEHNVLGRELIAMRDAFASRQAGKRFLGYMTAQRERLMGLRGQKNVRRPELEALHGYDTKYAMHMLRLGMQGVEYMQTGKLTLPMDESQRTWLMFVRRGEYSLQRILATAAEMEGQLVELLERSPLPEHPDAEKVNRFVVEAYMGAWPRPGAYV